MKNFKSLIKWKKPVKIEEDIKKGINLSPKFKNVKDAMGYLNKQ